MLKCVTILSRGTRNWVNIRRNLTQKGSHTKNVEELKNSEKKQARYIYAYLVTTNLHTLFCQWLTQRRNNSCALKVERLERKINLKKRLTSEQTLKKNHCVICDVNAEYIWLYLESCTIHVKSIACVKHGLSHYDWAWSRISDMNYFDALQYLGIKT